MFRTLLFVALFVPLIAGRASAQRYGSGAEPEQSGAYDNPSSIGKYSGSYKGGDRNGTSAPGRSYIPQYVSTGKYRQPTSLIMLDANRSLIATKLTGEIYQFTVDDRSVSLAYSNESRQFQRMVRLPENLIAVTDTLSSEVVILRYNDETHQCDEVVALKIVGGPNGLCFDAANSQLWVSSAWAQRLYRLDVTIPNEPQGQARLSHVQSIDLPMCGGQILCVEQAGIVLVTDAFGCDFVVLDQATGNTINHDRLYEHNVCQLTSIDDGKSVLLPQQLLSGLTAALESDITWGNFLSNNLRVLPLERLASHQGDEIYTGSKYLPIGEFGNGAGDPTSMAMHGANELAVTIGGTNQVALGTLDGLRFRFVDVGFHPMDCEFTVDGKTLVVVNQFSDSISLVDVETRTAEHVSLGDLRPPSETEHGEMLFHDSTLSHDSWMSCQSCHSSGHTNGLLTDNFTDKSYRSPKRVLSLLGQSETAPYGWAGTMETLEDQIAFSIKSTMASDEAVRSEDVKQLAAYVRSLPRPPSLVDARTSENTDPNLNASIARGLAFFNSAGCVDCHSGPQYTSPETYDVGLKDERELREFNPPSLIGVSQRHLSLLHDSRAKSLHDVIVKENHQMPSSATDDQRRDLIQFLMSL